MPGKAADVLLPMPMSMPKVRVLSKFLSWHTDQLYSLLSNCKAFDQTTNRCFRGTVTSCSSGHCLQSMVDSSMKLPL